MGRKNMEIEPFQQQHHGCGTIYVELRSIDKTGSFKAKVKKNLLKLADFLAIDYSKAFDRVDITVALHKLLQMGVRHELLPWVGDFLSGHRQRTRVNGTTSNWFEVTCGVPQGTTLGPVIFLAMVNSVAEHHGDRCKFVDDITAVARNKPSVPTNPELQRVMLAIRDDASKDHMTLNIAKCSTMRTAAAGRPNFIPLCVDGTEVPHISTMKLLGVTIQCNLKWDKQVEAMVAKANTCRYVITVLKQAGVQLRDLVRCYCTLHSAFTGIYCPCVAPRSDQASSRPS